MDHHQPEMPSCAECGNPYNTTTHRLVRETCGHEKCRQCLLLALDGCAQCLPQEKETEEATASEAPEEPQYDVIVQSDDQQLYWSREGPDGEQHQEVVEDMNDYEYVDGPLVDEGAAVVQYQESVVVESELEQPENGEEAEEEEEGDTFNEDHVEYVEVIEEKRATAKDLTKRDDHLPPHILKLGAAEEDKMGRPRYHCTLCDKVISRTAITYHTYCSPDIPKPFPCGQCDKSFRTADHLRYHENTHADTGGLTCDVCDKKFRNQATLKTHVRTFHSETPAPHSCEDCGKQFYSQVKLEIHQRIHKNVFPFSCTECNKKFRFRENLLKHVQITHSTVKPFSCEECGIGFKRKGALTAHMQRTHPSETVKLKVLPCPHCGEEFTHYTQLSRHKKTHTDSKLYYHCSRCKTDCSRRDNILRHIRSMHFNGDMTMMPVLNQDYTTTENEPALDREDYDDVDSKDAVDAIPAAHSHEQARKSSVIIFAGGTQKAENRQRPEPMSPRPKRMRGREAKEDEIKISSDKMTIYRKILMLDDASS